MSLSKPSSWALLREANIVLLKGYALTYLARLRHGDKILIHSAAGSTGQMAVKIARMHGAEVFVTVGTEEKRQLVTSPDGLNIPASHVFYSRDTSFAAGVMRVTSGYGVDVVLNSLSGSGLRASWECMAPYGRFIDIGKSDIDANTPLPMAGFARNVSFASVDLHHVIQTNIPLTRELVEKSLQLSVDGMLGVPSPLHLFPTSELLKALRYMQSGKNTGRILVTIHPDDVVLVRHSTSVISQFEIVFTNRFRNHSFTSVVGDSVQTHLIWSLEVWVASDALSSDGWPTAAPEISSPCQDPALSHSPHAL